MGGGEFREKKPHCTLKKGMAWGFFFFRCVWGVALGPFVKVRGARNEGSQTVWSDDLSNDEEKPMSVESFFCLIVSISSGRL